MRSEGPITAVMRKEKSNLGTGAVRVAYGPRTPLPAGLTPASLSPGPGPAQPREVLGGSGSGLL